MTAIDTATVREQVFRGVHVLVHRGQIYFAFLGQPRLCHSRQVQGQTKAQAPQRARSHTAPQPRGEGERRFISTSIAARKSTGLAGARSTSEYSLTAAARAALSGLYITGRMVGREDVDWAACLKAGASARSANTTS